MVPTWRAVSLAQSNSTPGRPSCGAEAAGASQRTPGGTGGGCQSETSRWMRWGWGGPELAALGSRAAAARRAAPTRSRPLPTLSHEGRGIFLVCCLSRAGEREASARTAAGHTAASRSATGCRAAAWNSGASTGHSCASSELLPGALACAGLLVEVRVADQVHAPACARDGDIEQAPVFLPLALLLQPRRAAVDRVLVTALLAHRGQQQIRPARRVGPLQPLQQLRLVVARAVAQAGHDHGVELQALALVDGHDLQRLGSLRVGQREQLGQPLVQRREVLQIPALARAHRAGRGTPAHRPRRWHPPRTPARQGAATRLRPALRSEPRPRWSSAGCSAVGSALEPLRAIRAQARIEPPGR